MRFHIALCDIIGHTYESEVAEEWGDCSRCSRKNRPMTELEMAHAYGVHPWWVWLLPSWMWHGMRHLWARLVCKFRGHEWEDEGWATPDSGCIDMVCQRCGYSPGRHWLY